MLSNIDVVIPAGMAFLRKNNFLYFFFCIFKINFKISFEILYQRNQIISLKFLKLFLKEN